MIAEKFRAISDDPELNLSQEENETYIQPIAEARHVPITTPISAQEIKRAIAQSRALRELQALTKLHPHFSSLRVNNQYS
jgi:hypothetical protein